MDEIHHNLSVPTTRLVLHVSPVGIFGACESLSVYGCSYRRHSPFLPLHERAPQRLWMIKDTIECRDTPQSTRPDDLREKTVGAGCWDGDESKFFIFFPSFPDCCQEQPTVVRVKTLKK